MKNINKQPITLVSLVAVLATLTACGTMPVPGLAEFPASAETQVAQTEPVPAESDLPDLPMPAAKERKPRVLYNTARGYWLQATRDLQEGDVDNARLSLVEALALDPGNETAKKLLAQLDADPKKELGSENFQYQVQPGETLSVLAKNFLNDSLRFYILARYNGIENPSQVQVGQVILIPGKKAMAPKPAVVAVEESELTKAKADYKQKQYDKVIERLEPMLGAAGDDAKVNDEIHTLLASAYLRQSELQVKAGRVDQARVMVEKAEDLRPNHPELAAVRQKLAGSSKADAQFEEGMAALNSGDKLTAYDKFTKVLVAQPNHRQAAKQQTAIRADVVETYYKEALKAQRKQQLSQAIPLWDKLLAIDPDNENAKLYRAKAEDLKLRLQKFVGDN